ncbi:MAG: type II secretion system protein GspG [Candidatus Eremiobacteraeota bacterium]|nr:type II secretion system protein GspG [Candidatus Eremiobacteraeota bacterium]
MHDDNIDMNNNNKPIKINMIWIIVIVILNIIVVAFIFLYIRYWHVPNRSDEVEKVIKRVEKRMADLESIPPEENGWTYYNEASQCLNTDPIKKAYTGPAGGIGSNYLIEYFREKINTSEKLALIKRCASINKKSINLVDKGFEKDMIFVPPHFISQKGLGKEYENLISFECFLVMLGDYKREIGNSKTASKRYLESIIIGMKNEDARMVYWTGFSYYAKKQLLNLINDTENSKETYKYIINKIDKIEKLKDDFTKKEETTLYLLNESNDRINKPVQMPIDGPLRFIPWNIIIERERSITNNLYLDFLKNSGSPYPESIKKFQNIEPPEYISFFSYFPDTLVESYKRYNIEISSLRGMKLLCALKYYRAENGKYPDSLNELVPKYINKIPKDPFPRDGKYIYKKKPDGSILLYSIGPDLKDDMGRNPGPYQNIIADGDIVFTSTKPGKKKGN